MPLSSQKLQIMISVENGTGFLCQHMTFLSISRLRKKAEHQACMLTFHGKRTDSGTGMGIDYVMSSS